MINLLPQSERSNLRAEKKYRLVMILCSVVLFFLISSSLILFSLKIYISSQSRYQSILVASAENQLQSPQTQNLEAAINSINGDLAKLSDFYKTQVRLTEVLEKISQTIPDGMYLINLSLDGSKVSLGGHSLSREILFEFKKRLEAEPSFEEIILPPASWVTPENFTATFKLKI